MNYGQARDYLRKLETFGVKLGLDKIRVLLAGLGDPQLTYPSALVAGTNGKGSVCAMLAAILKEHGLRAGLYTSPHLVKVEERIRIGGRLISRRDFCRLTSFLKNTTERLLKAREISSLPTYFEFLTALALLYFRQESVDIAILEVGMGGRFDATNAVTPLISVVTSISRDHEEHLGAGLSRIAREKAGIIKPGIPAVCGVARGVARGILKKRATELRAPFLGVFDHRGAFRAEKRRHDYRFAFEWSGERYDFTPRLQGEHQGRNAAVAIAAAVELGRQWKTMDKTKIIRGVSEAHWPGRLETISRRPLFMVDGAHNEGGAEVLRKYIEDFELRPLILVFGVMKDKAVGKMTRLLFPFADRIIITRAPLARSASLEQIRDAAPEFRSKILTESDVKGALTRALSLAGRKGIVLATGSLFLVGEIKKLLPQRKRSIRLSCPSSFLSKK